MITVETSLRSMEREIADLAMNPYDAEDLTAFKMGAVICLQWLIQGKMKPSEYCEMYKKGLEQISKEQLSVQFNQGE